MTNTSTKCGVVFLLCAPTILQAVVNKNDFLFIFMKQILISKYNFNGSFKDFYREIHIIGRNLRLY